MKTICIANQKGGVGKSTTALAIGAGLVAKGKRVLFVDLDAQGNLSFSMASICTSGYGVAGVLQRPETVKEEIQSLPEFGLIGSASILPSTPFLSGMDMVLTETGKEYRLREALANVSDAFDFCVIDTPPSLGVLTVNALTASDLLIVPAPADVYGLHGIAQLSQTVETVKRYCNPSLSFAGIVLVRFNPRVILSRDLAQVIGEKAKEMGTKVYTTTIPECVSVREAQAVQQSIFQYAPNSTASIAYSNLIEEITKELPNV